MSENVKAYTGDKPYIFISYAHKDSEQVLAVIRRLQNDGYRVWYDEGIAPGTAWDQNIAEHLHGCTCFLSFISASYINSSNCRDEMSYCRKNGKSALMIYLEKVELSSGMKMRYGRFFSVFKYSSTEDAVFEKIYSLANIEKTKE